MNDEGKALKKGISRRGFWIDERARRLYIRDRMFQLTAMECSLILTMAERPNTVFSRERLMSAVWGYETVGDDRTVDTHICNLRTKIEADPKKPEYLKTLRGKGYFLNI